MSQLSIRALKEKSPRHIPTVSSELSDEESLSTWGASHRPSPDWQYPNTPSISLDHSMQMHLQSRSITATESISCLLDYILQIRSITPSKLARSSRNHVHLQSRSMTAFECISKLTWSQPPIEYPNLHDHGHEVRMIMVSPNSSSNSLNCGLGKYLWFHAIISNMYCSRWEPPGVSERRRSINLDETIAGKNQTLGGHYGRPSE
jgi:hypothetical protein